MDIPRILSKKLPKSTDKQLILITGARQTGKTTLVQYCYTNLPYYNLDAPENRIFMQETSTFHWAKNVGNAVIDEAQKEPLVFEKVKHAYDLGEIHFSVLLGSSQIVLLKKIRESLAGRIALYELYPLMLCEIANRTEHQPLLAALLTINNIQEMLTQQASLVDPKQEALLKEAGHYLLQWGGMPKLLSIQDEEARQKWLKDYEYTYLERDLTDLARLDDLQPFRTLQKIGALRSAQLLNYSELARDAGMTAETAKRYLQYLQLSYQVVLLQPFYRNLTSTTIKTPKIYWLDMGILRSLTGQFQVTLGSHFETFVVAEIIKWIKTTNCHCDSYFYRSRSGLEVDLLLQTPHGILAIEIKQRDRVYAKDYSGLIAIAKELKQEWLGGLVVYTGNTLQQIAQPNIWMIPAWRLLS